MMPPMTSLQMIDVIRPILLLTGFQRKSLHDDFRKWKDEIYGCEGDGDVKFSSKFLANNV